MNTMRNRALGYDTLYYVRPLYMRTYILDTQAHTHTHICKIYMQEKRKGMEGNKVKEWKRKKEKKSSTFCYVSRIFESNLINVVYSSHIQQRQYERE